MEWGPPTRRPSSHSPGPHLALWNCYKSTPVASPARTANSTRGGQCGLVPSTSYRQTNPVLIQIIESCRSPTIAVTLIKVSPENGYLRGCPFLLSRGCIRNDWIKHVSISSIKMLPKRGSLLPRSLRQALWNDCLLKVADRKRFVFPVTPFFL